MAHIDAQGNERRWRPDGLHLALALVFVVAFTAFAVTQGQKAGWRKAFNWQSIELSDCDAQLRIAEDELAQVKGAVPSDYKATIGELKYELAEAKAKKTSGVYHTVLVNGEEVKLGPFCPVCGARMKVGYEP